MLEQQFRGPSEQSANDSFGESLNNMQQLDADSLIKAGRQLSEPFLLSLKRGDDALLMLTVVKILRLLPGKRIVAVAKVDGKTLLVKVFIGRFSRRYEKRETFGVRAIERAGVLTPALSWHAELSCGNGHILAFEYIPDALNLIDVWKSASDDEARFDLILKVMPVLAKLHSSGVVQNDIHPENFLFANDLIYTIDGGDVSHRDHSSLSEQKSVENLALFFAQFPESSDIQTKQMLAAYCEQREWSGDQLQFSELRNHILRLREARKLDYIDKAFRDCTRFYCEQFFGRFLVCERRYDSSEMRALFDDIDRVMADGQSLKAGNSATVALVDGPTGPLVIKRYNIKGFWHGLSRLFRPSRAWISWANTMRLEFLDISTVRPVALIENRWGPFRRTAYFVTEHVEGPDARSLAELDDPTETVASIKVVLKSLSNAGVSHGDLKASNFLLSERGPVIIDLDSMKEHRDPVDHRKAEKRDLERFMRNWETSPELQQHFADLLD